MLIADVYFPIWMMFINISHYLYSKRRWAEGVLNNNLKNVFDNNGFWIGLHDRITEDVWYWDEGPGVAGL